MTRRKPIARTCAELVRVHSPSHKMFDGSGRTYEGKRDDGLESSSSHGCGIAEAAGRRVGMNIAVAVPFPDVSPQVFTQKDSPIDRDPRELSFGRFQRSDVGACHSVLGCWCLRLPELMLHTASPYLPAPASHLQFSSLLDLECCFLLCLIEIFHFHTYDRFAPLSPSPCSETITTTMPLPCKINPNHHQATISGP